jgi:hypothetical protein
MCRFLKLPGTSFSLGRSVKDLYQLILVHKIDKARFHKLMSPFGELSGAEAEPSSGL